MIPKSLQSLLAGVVDYAGLFPPAKLPMDQALANYLRYRSDDDRWILGHFVCPAARLGEIATFGKSIAATNTPIRISALGRGGNSPAEFMVGLQADLADLDACRERHAGKVLFPALEMKLPVDLLSFDHRLRDLLAAIAEATVISRMTLFFEAPLNDTELLDRLFTALGETPFASLVGIKFRTGGLEASAFPPCSRLALALAQCLRAGVPMKATAGLHHPLPRFDPTLDVLMNGFINLFSAAALGQAQRLPASVLQEILEEEEPGAFSFTDESLAWRGEMATTEQVSRARLTAVTSFGSCSFDEPLGDLRELGWLGTVKEQP